MGFWIRFGAWFIDYVVVLGAINILISIVLSDVFGLLGLPILWLYFWLFTGLKGQTLGKMAVRIKVVDDQGDVPGLGRAALRELLGKPISVIVIFLGLFWIAWDKQKQGWHDKIATTYVVKTSTRATPENPRELPRPTTSSAHKFPRSTQMTKGDRPKFLPCPFCGEHDEKGSSVCPSCGRYIRTPRR